MKHRLGTALPSLQLLRVANGAIVESEARWKGKIEVNGINTNVEFEVFDSRGKWDFLFGKALLEKFKAIHDYESDKITVHRTGGKTTLYNQAHITQPQPKPTPPVCIVTDEMQMNGDKDLLEVDMGGLKNNTDLFTRLTWLHKPEHMQELLQLVTIGNELSTEERQKVYQLVSSFADIFALSVSEVKVIEGTIHWLDIPPEASFSMKIHQKPLMPPQHWYLYKSIDTMLEARVIEACKPDDIKYISATILAQKTHKGKGLLLKELQHRVNDECISNGMDTKFDLPPRTSPTPDNTPSKEPKWRICQNFSQINKITKVTHATRRYQGETAMPQWPQVGLRF